MITFMDAVHAAYPKKIYGWDGVDRKSLVITGVDNVDFDLIDAKLAELQAAEPMRQLRIQRDQLLSATDWWCVSDRTATPAQLAYRQALRDLPANCTPALDENGNLTNVNWPEPPTE